MTDVDPKKIPEILREAEDHTKHYDEYRHGLHKEGKFIRRGRVEAMKYHTVRGEGEKKLVHCEVTIGTVFESFTLKVMNDEAAAPFQVDGRVEIIIRKVPDDEL
jgi:hypothetical protein